MNLTVLGFADGVALAGSAVTPISEVATAVTTAVNDLRSRMGRLEALLAGAFGRRGVDSFPRLPRRPMINLCLRPRQSPSGPSSAAAVQEDPIPSPCRNRPERSMRIPSRVAAPEMSVLLEVEGPVPALNRNAALLLCRALTQAEEH